MSQNDDLIKALKGKNLSMGGMNLNELKLELIQIFPQEKSEIENYNRKEIQNKYLKRIKFKENKSINLLVLCATNETLLNQKTFKNVIKWFVIKNNIKFKIYYVNSSESELIKTHDTVITNVSDLNLNIFSDNFFDIIIDEFCPFNSPNVLTINTFNWIYRILKKSGIFIINDFSNVFEHNATIFYDNIKNNFCTLTDTNKLLNYIRDDFDPDFADQWEKESMEEDDPHDYIFRNYINILVEDHYNEYLHGIKRIFMIGDKNIANLKEFKKFLYFNLLSFKATFENFENDNYIVLEKI